MREDVGLPGWASRAVLSAAPVMDSLVLSRVDLEESGVIFSAALVWKSLRAASDILMVGCLGWLVLSVGGCVDVSC